MSKSLQELGLKEEQLPTAGQALADLPEFGTFTPPPPPGAYRFKLPGDLSAIYDVFDVEGKGQRIVAIFDREHPLLITQSIGGKSNGLPFETRINNNERTRGKKDSGVVASDFDYLLRALKVTTKPTSNRGYIEALKTHGPNKEFGADLRYSWNCSQARDIRAAMTGADGTVSIQPVEGKKGCGAKFYQEDVPKQADGSVPYEITCTCGAHLRAFANLDNIRS